MMDESGMIENSKRQLEELSDDRLKEILISSHHGNNNKRWATDILTDRRLARLEKSCAVIAESITANPSLHRMAHGHKRSREYEIHQSDAETCAPYGARRCSVYG